MKKTIRACWSETCALLAVCAMYFSGCGGGGASEHVSNELAVSVSVAPSSVALGATSQATATVLNDSSNSGVMWALMQNGAACSPGCGTISSQSFPERNTDQVHSSGCNAC